MSEPRRRSTFAFLQTMGAQVLILGCNLATGVLMARLLGAEGRGEYAAVTLWPQLLAMLAVSGLSGAIVVRMRSGDASRAAVSGAALLIALVTSALALLAGALTLPHALSNYPAEVAWFAQLCLASVFVNSLTLVLRQALIGAGEFTLANVANLLPQLLHLAALLAVLPLGVLTPRNAILALLGAGLVSLLALLPSFLRRFRPTLRGARAELRALLSFSGRASMNDVVYTFGMHLDRLVLIPLLAPAQLGLYAVAFSFSRTLQLAQPAVMTVLLSRLAGREAGETKPLHDHAVRFLLAGMAGGCAVLWLVGEWLLRFAFGDEFAAANLIFRVLAVEAALSVLSQVTIQLFLAHDRPGVVSTLQVGTLGVSAVGLLLLVPPLGALGAAIALLIAGAARWAALLLAMRRVLRLPLPRLLLNRADLRYLTGTLR
jgi:O-antigen/teichoic acid export membrane protein